MKLLFVDDEPGILDQLVKMLICQRHDVDTADDGDNADLAKTYLCGVASAKTYLCGVASAKTYAPGALHYIFLFKANMEISSNCRPC
jgi:hypothetical protein